MPAWRDLAWSLRVVTPPTVQPVSVAEVKHRLRISGTADDADLSALILAAREQVERDTNEALVATVFDQVISGGSPSDRGPIVLGRYPVQSVASVTAYDSDDTASTVATSVYRVDTLSRPSRLSLKTGQVWPTDLRSEGGLVVRFTAGYSGTAATVSSITRSGTTATVTTSAAHGYATGQRVTLAGADQADYNGTFEITVTGASTFTVTVSGSPATPATGVLTATDLGVPESRRLAMLLLIGHWWDRARNGLLLESGESADDLPFAYWSLLNDRDRSLA